MKTILVTGANGQLGNELKYLENSFTDFKFIFTDKQALDITNNEAILSFFKINEIDFCINTAAYTAVDNAEDDQENAMLLNATAVKYLAEVCKEFNAKLIHVSTDFVFDGKGNIPLKEENKPNPLSVYGATKLKGEEFALENNALVIRTSWLYSTFGNNFVKTMLRLGTERDELNIIADQFGTPTYAKDLAKAILDIISNNKVESIKGLYHFSNDGEASWFDFTKEIFSISNINCKANPIPTTEYPTPAERPKYSVMDKSKIVDDFGVVMKDWKVSLKECIEKLNI
ncbi:MAG: dTDP-4-dehydrorhamnose reductase [Chitinophagales bacterium]